MLGNEAIARGAYEAGATVATAYPGTPSTEITEYIAQYKEIDAEWSVNEKVALEIAIGASIAGARAITAMKHVGLNVAADPFMSVSYPGVNGGLVLVVADDPGQHSSQNEQDTRYFGIFAKVPVLEPSDSQECLDFVKKAFEISESFDTPVIIRLSTRVSHSQTLVTIGERDNIPLKKFDKNPAKYVVAPSFARKRRIFAEERLERLKAWSDASDLNSIEFNDTKIGVVTSGIAYQYAREVLPDASYLKLGISYPLPENKLREFAAHCEKIYVIEELEPIFEEKMRALGIDVIGKEIFPVIGEMSEDIIRKAMFNTSAQAFNSPFSEPLPVRPPVLCPGCHHRGPFYVLKKLKLYVSGDIGCYTLGAFPPLNSMDTCICMGASIGMAFGFEKARGKDFAKKSVAVIGDSTFWHSGITALIDLVYNKGYTTVIILDNLTTGMTGHQENPSTGLTLNGMAAPLIDFELLGKAIGINRIHTIDAYDLENLEKVIKTELKAPEPSLIITKKPCALLKTVKPNGKTYQVLPDECNGCKLCMKIGCPAISFDNEANIIEINEDLCNGCALCADICNLNAIVVGDKGFACGA
jgi:indolepyruvate ferredoxin oxidoreductase, alpha subunit